MIKIDSLINVLKKNDINFFTGIPDSVLIELSHFLQNSFRVSNCYKYE